MKTGHVVTGVLATLVWLSAAAHDPKEHQREAARAQAPADCSKLKGMDMNKMDMNDPVMKALHKKCEAQRSHHDERAAQTDVQASQPAEAKEAPSHADCGGTHAKDSKCATAVNSESKAQKTPAAQKPAKE